MKKLTLLLSLLLVSILSLPATLWAAQSNAPARVNVLAEGDEGDDEEDPEPYIEPAFTVYVTVDNADAVRFTVNDQPIAHIAGENVITVDPGDGYIKVYVNEGYLFNRFDDIDQLDSSGKATSYLQYTPPTDYTVTIRKTTSVGMTEDDVIINDGHHFVVETFDTTALQQFTLTVNVDNASLAEATIGSSPDMISQANRSVQLVDGVNTITFTELDKYIHFCGSDFNHPLEGVTNNGKKVVDDGQVNKVYTVMLKGSKSQGSEIVVTTFKEEVNPYSFTLDIDDIESVRYFTKMPANKGVSLLGNTSVPFKDGDYFEVGVYQQAFKCQFNGENLSYDEATRSYRFTPVDGGVFTLKFVDDTPQVPSFSVYVDDASKVSRFINFDDDSREYTLVDGYNTIEIEFEGDQFRLYTVGNVAPYSITYDGASVKYNSKGYYYFSSKVDAELVVLFNEPSTPMNTVTLNVNDASHIVAFTGGYANAGTTINLVNGENILKFDTSVVDFKIAVDEGYKASVTDAAGEEFFFVPEYAYYLIGIEDGLTVNVSVREVSFNEYFLVYVEQTGTLEVGEMASFAGRYFTFEEGFNEIAFDSEYDMGMIFISEPLPEAVYVNGELLELDEEEGVYIYTPENGDIVRIYLSKVPEKHNVIVEVDPNLEDKFILARDLYQEVDATAANCELDGTYYVIIPIDASVQLRVMIYPEDYDIPQAAPVHGYAPIMRSASAFEPYEIPFNEDESAFIFTVDKGMKVAITDAFKTGVDSIEADAAAVEVYDLRGNRLSNGRLSAPGIYIVNGKKQIMK